MKKHLEKMIADFNDQKTDTDKFKYLIENKGIFKLMLDNDGTFIVFTDGTEKHFTEEEIDTLTDSIDGFDNYIGWANGTFSLLEAIGIEAESV